MATTVTLSREKLDAIRMLPKDSVLVIDGTIAEMSAGYTKSCRGIDPDQLGVAIEQDLPQPLGDFTQPVPNVPLYIDKEIMQSAARRGKTPKIAFVPVANDKCRFVAFAK